MRTIMLLAFVAVSGCAYTVEELCYERAERSAKLARKDRNAQWCVDDTDGVRRCKTPGLNEFYGQCMASPPIDK